MKINKVFCVIDPTTPRQRALIQAVAAAKGAKAALHLYACAPLPFWQNTDDKEALREAEVARYQAWLDQLAAGPKKQGIKVSTEVECDDNWRESLAPAAKRWGADLIVKSSFRRSSLQRRLLKTSDWTLLRNASCPVVLVKTERDKPVSSVIAAVNLNAKDKAHVKLTDKVISAAQAIANTRAQLHAVNAYNGSLEFVHPPDLAKRVGTKRQFAHVGDKSPEALLSEVAATLDNPLVVVGSIARRGVPGLVVGNTAERILDSVPADILVIMQSGKG